MVSEKIVPIIGAGAQFERIDLSRPGEMTIFLHPLLLTPWIDR